MKNDILKNNIIKLNKIILRGVSGLTAFSMSALVFIINTKAASQEPEINIKSYNYHFYKLSIDENNTFTRRLTDKKVKSFFDNSCLDNPENTKRVTGGGVVSQCLHICLSQQICRCLQ